MKLFTVAQQVSSREAITTSEIKRLDTVNKELTKKRHELEQLEADFVVLIDRQREQLEVLQSKNIKELNTFTSQVQVLENRKQQALIPLEVEAKKLDTEHKGLSLWEARLKERQEEIEEQAEILQERLSEVSGRESDVNHIAKKQVISQQGIDAQRAQVALQSKEMSNAMVSTIAEFNTRDSSISRRETVSSLKEEQLASKEKEIIARENDFARREALLADRYAMLERTIKQNAGN